VVIRTVPQRDKNPKIANCPRCDELVVVGALGPVKYRLSVMSVPLSDAKVLAKYGHLIYNIWRHEVMPGWVATDWWDTYPISKGRLYVEHDCDFRK